MMNFKWIIFLSLLLFWWTYRQNSEMIDVLKCAMDRGIYNKSLGKCDIIELDFVIYKKTNKSGEKLYPKINYTSIKKQKRKIGL